MAKSLSDGVTTVPLHDDLWWANEHSYSPVKQVTERTLTGALVVNAGLEVGGRPMVLQAPDENSAWLTGAVLAQLKAWAAVPLKTLTLVWPTGTRQVMFDQEAGAVDATLVVHYSDPDSADYYTVTIRLLDVTP